MRAELVSTALLLYLPGSGLEAEPALLQWRWTASAGERPATGTGLGSLRAALAASTVDAATIETTLILPAELAVTTTVVVPSDKPQHIRAAAPNLLEESLISDSELLHFAYGIRTESGDVPLIAIDREVFTSRLQAVKEIGLHCDRVAIDASLVPSSQNALALVLHDERILVSWNIYRAGAIETAESLPLLEAILRTTPTRKVQLTVLATASAAAQTAMENTLASLQRTHALDIERNQFDGALLEFIVNSSTRLSAPPIDLRQAEFRAIPRGNNAWRRWRPVAYVALGLLLAQLLLNLATGALLLHRAHDMRTTAETLYRELFPNDRRLVNLQQQFQSQLGSLPGDKRRTFLELFGELAREIQKSPGNPPIQLRSLVYDTSAGTLLVDLAIADVQALDELQKRLSNGQLQARVLSASAAEQGGILGRLSLSGG